MTANHPLSGLGSIIAIARLCDDCVIMTEAAANATTGSKADTSHQIE